MHGPMQSEQKLDDKHSTNQRPAESHVQTLH